MSRTVLVVLGASALSFAVGVIVGREGGDDPAAAVQGGVAVEEPASAAVREGPAVGRRDPDGSTPRRVVQPAVPVGPPVEQMQVEQLRKELGEARAKLARFRAERAAEVGIPVPFPDELPEIYSQEVMLKRMTDAFRYAGIEADVTVADCAEYPCLLCGDVGRDEGEANVDEHLTALRKAAEAPSLEPYKDAEKHGSVMTSKEEQDGKVTHTTRFCQAMYPDPEDAVFAASIEQRLRYRVHQLEQGL